MFCYEAVSGLKVNFSISELLTMRVDDQLLSHYAEILGCKVGSFPATSLGLPLCTGKSPKSMWNPVIEKVEKRLSTRKVN